MTADLAPRRDDMAQPSRAALARAADYQAIRGRDRDFRMSDDTGSRRGRRPRPGLRTGIDLLLSARGDDEPSTAGSAADQKPPRRRSPFPSPRRLMSRPRVAVPIVIIVVAGVALGGWALTRPDGSAAASYRLIPATMTTMRQTLSSSGTIEPAATATLSFSAPGQVTAVDAQVGQHVTAGQTLAVMDSPTLKAQAAQAEASLAGAQSQLSQDQAGRASSAQLASDQASANAAQSQVDSANAALSGATLTSPIDGIVVSAGLTAGQQMSGGGGGSSGTGSSGGGSSGGGSAAVESGGDSGGGSSGTGSGGSSGSGSSTSSITVISANDVINGNVDATEVGQIKTGDQVVITTEGSAGPVSGTVASIGLIASTSSGVATFPLVIDVTGTPSGLYQGASATVSIIYHQVTNVLAVPAAAVLESGGKTVVDTIVKGRRVAKDVTTGLTTGGLTQITSGLTAGEQVVVTIPRLVSGGSGTSGNSGGGNAVFIGPGGGQVVVRGVPAGGGFGPGGG
jgi:multidrug efflux pump subunit AcrA (membrane-fusion protein)